MERITFFEMIENIKGEQIGKEWEKETIAVNLVELLELQGAEDFYIDINYDIENYSEGHACYKTIEFELPNTYVYVTLDFKSVQDKLYLIDLSYGEC